MSDNSPAGWQPDPTGRHDHRYWDGTAWTDNVSDAGVAGTDPIAAPAAPVGPDATVADAPGAPTPPTDATAAWSTSPTAPVPPAAQPVAGGGGSDSKKGLLIGGAILAVIAVIVAALLLGGGDDDEPNEASSDATTSTTESDSDSNGGVRALLIGALTNPDQGDLSLDDAECVADEVIAEVDGDVLADVDYSTDDPPLQIQSAMADAYETCGIGDGSTDDGSTGGDIPDDFVDQLAQIYESQMGLSSDQAQCLAERMRDVVQSGELDEQQAMSEIFDYLSDCDISMSDIDISATN
jgi:hypothetical protein